MNKGDANFSCSAEDFHQVACCYMVRYRYRYLYVYNYTVNKIKGKIKRK